MRRLLAAVGLCLALAPFAACDSAPNMAYLPVGSRCERDSDCGSTPFTCDTSYPGGYCQRPCATRADCPSDADCAQLKCRRSCASTADCRAAEGYVCKDSGAATLVCDR